MLLQLKNLETNYISTTHRLNATVATPKPKIQAEAVIWHLVKLFGSPHESGMRQRCTNLIHAIGIWQPEILDLLKERRKALDQAVQGILIISIRNLLEVII